MIQKPVLIVGGGIGGLTLSLCLSKEGIASRVFERRGNFAETGAGIQLSPNCMRVYDYLGIVDLIRSFAYEPDCVQFLDGKQNRILAEIQLGASLAEDYGFPYYNVNRAQLVELLARLASEDDLIQLYPGCEVTAFGSVGSDVKIEVDGNDFDGSLLVGADGINSTVRSQIFGSDEAVFTGHVAWRAQVPIESISSKFHNKVSRVWWGRRKHLVAYPVQNGRLLNCVAVVENKSWASDSWHQPGDPRELTEEFADWAPEVQEIIKSIPSSDLFKWGLFHRSDLKTWREGLFVLLGDACHAPLPFMAQGAAMAIEDAACLALCLSRSDSVKSGFEAYEEFRKSRTQKVKSMSARNGRIFHLSGVAAFLRNNFLKVFDLKVDRFLYSYNVFDINERLGNKGSTLL